jgi:hypothetical protein
MEGIDILSRRRWEHDKQKKTWTIERKRQCNI